MYVYPKLIRKGQNTRSSIAVRIPKVDDMPQELWLAHISSGEALVATTTRVYGATASWRQEFSLGPALDVAVMFDERWQANVEGKYRPTTLGEPQFYYIVPITNYSGKLVVSNGWGTTPTTLVDEGVESVSAIHGWKNVRNHYEDQGRIIAYVRDGELWYLRRYETSSAGIYTWDAPQKIDCPERVKNVQVFRTPDYRVAFQYMTETGKVYLSYSSRVFAGVGVTSPDTINLSATFDAALKTDHIVDVYRSMNETVKIEAVIGTGITSAGTDGTTGLITKMYNADAYTVFVHLNIGSVLKDSTLMSFRDATGRRFRLSSVIVTGSTESGSILKCTLEDFNNANGDITLTITDGALVTGSNATITIPSRSFTPTGLIPVYKPLPNLVSIYNEEVL